MVVLLKVETLNSDAKIQDAKIQDAAERVLELLRELKVAYDRELRYRLEGEFPHDVTGKAIDKLTKEGKIKRTNLPGRRGGGTSPNVFYRLPRTDYRELIPIMKEKLDLSIFVATVTREMGYYAEILWKDAFRRNGWDLYPTEEGSTGCKEYKGKATSVGNDIDFIAEKKDIVLGVEVKNGLAYPKDLYWKIHVAMDIEVVPLVVARWLNPRQVRLLRDIRCPFVIYREAIFTDTYKEIVEKVRNVLGYPVGARSEVDDEYFKKKVDPIYRLVMKHPTYFDDLKEKWEPLQK